MQWLEQLSSNLVFTREYLKAGVLVSLLAVWVLVALFYYLNRYTRRRYFTIWTAAWLFYALWITLSFRVPGNPNEPPLLMFQQWCVGVSAIFLLWGSRSFMGEKVNQVMLGLFFIFLAAWSYLGAYLWRSRPLEMEIPVFSLIALASVITAGSFFKYRRKNPSYIGATLLTLGFFLWGIYMAGYPFLENSQDLTSLALFISAGLQLMMAVSMIILVLEEVRQTQQAALAEAQTRKQERDKLHSRVVSTEERYRKLFDQASEAIVIASADDLRMLELNQAAERLLGVSREEARRQSLTAFCHVESAGAPPASGAEWFQAICRQRPLNLTRKNGALTPVEINGAQIDFDGQPAYQFFLLELTERARLEQQLRQAEKLSAIGQMISGIAHELNNPLAVVKGYLELVLTHHELTPQTRADLEKAAHESNRAAKLVMNFLTFARGQRSHREPVSLNDLARQLVELRRADFAAGKTEVELELDPVMTPILADPDQVQQLVVNLTNNSMQAMANSPKAHRIKIKTIANGSRVQLAVEDNGPGVPAHLVNKIFEPFFTTKEVGSGTGLGLSIAHSLMTEHKGRIYYQTSSLGGAGFVLEFPKPAPGDLKKAADGTTTVITKPTEKQPTGAGKVLVLDDEVSIAEMLGEILDVLGYKPTLCHAGSQALELVRRDDFDLVISDFRMPQMNGRQFYEEAVKLKPALAKRVVYLTGDVVNEETQSFLKSIGNPHMAKPFTLASVSAILAQALQNDAAKAAAH